MLIWGMSGKVKLDYVGQVLARRQLYWWWRAASVPWAPMITLPTFGQISPQRATGKHQPLPHTVCVAVQRFRNKENAISINAKVYNCIILPFHCLLHICCGHCTLYSVHCSWPLDSPFQHQVQSTTFKLVPPLFLQLKIWPVFEIWNKLHL